MRLSLEALIALDTIASEGSFAKAAEVLHKVPSALTYTMQKLESDLDVLLFDRSGKRAVLTPIGQALLESGRELIRQAEATERRIKRLAQGWETQITLALDGVVPLEWLHEHIRAFDALGCGTRLKFTHEIFGGVWDALIDRRADLGVGAPGSAPTGFGLISREWMVLESFVFACAPTHPLASAPEPLTGKQIALHRAIVVSDSSRRIAGRTAGVQPAQETLHVPSLADKIKAQVAGLGVGFVPPHIAAAEIASGQLQVKAVEDQRERTGLQIAWREGEEGLALQWWRERLLAANPGQTAGS